MTDIVERLRARTPYPAPVLAEAADEIERLRTNLRLTQITADAWARGWAEQAAEAHELQSLIDAYAEAHTRATGGDGRYPTYLDHDARNRAQKALLAAATPKEDDQ